MDISNLREDQFMQLIKSAIKAMSIEEAEKAIEYERKIVWNDSTLSIEIQKQIDVHLQIMLMRNGATRLETRKALTDDVKFSRIFVALSG
jgi:hypothetical protein